RIGAAAANPYLSLAAYVAAGVDGIKNKLEPPPPTSKLYGGEGPELPKDLGEALKALESDIVMCESLGSEFIQSYIAIKRFELKKAIAAGVLNNPHQVTDWERSEYLEYV